MATQAPTAQANTVQLQKLHYHRQRKLLDVQFADRALVQLSAEFLRVHSPSAEVRGHGQARLVLNKAQVAITSIVPVGHYAVKLVFDDGHFTGLYSWPYLLQLTEQHEALWATYLQQVAAAEQAKHQVPIRFFP